jgi:hypothetical protein
MRWPQGIDTCVRGTIACRRKNGGNGGTYGSWTRSEHISLWPSIEKGVLNLKDLKKGMWLGWIVWVDETCVPGPAAGFSCMETLILK